MPASVGPGTWTAASYCRVTKSFLSSRGRSGGNGCWLWTLGSESSGDGSSDGSWLWRRSFCYWRYLQAPPWPTMEGRERATTGMIRLRFHLKREEESAKVENSIRTHIQTDDGCLNSGSIGPNANNRFIFKRCQVQLSARKKCALEAWNKSADKYWQLVKCGKWRWFQIWLGFLCFRCR